MGEVEAALSDNSTVKEAIVVVLGESEHKRLVAYIVPIEPSVEKGKLPGYSFIGGQIDPVQTKQVFGKPSEEDTSIPQQLHEHLQGKLPQYMLPNDYVLMDVFPLTANGKVNRKALPAPEVSVQKRSFQPPSTPIEEKLAGIWATILELEVNQVGVNDNFFDLGGNSLLATQLISKIRQFYQVDLPLSDFFEEPTIAGLVEHIEVISWMAQDIQYSETTHIKEIEL
ncbi:phosphopantetheine-binding protein [Moorena sp. SIO4G3]|uniref:phosphopantetheine-binding protein n=1 Tax=Moorena sp. SIO4G3 TaxID=2607821 RepID=UPI00142CF4DD|nr:phosphopantetheine-binding protein [Moorena sp. SIO4G3]NEO77708.1 hypothetical protein [Moorena sp. SIO4G3]